MTNITDLPPDIIYKIYDFKIGDNTYWNTKFKDVANQFNNTYFSVKLIGVVIYVISVINVILI